MSLIFLPPKTSYFHRCPLSISLSGKLNSWLEATQIWRKEVYIIHFLGKKGKALQGTLLIIKAGNSTRVTASLNWAHTLQTQGYAHTQAPWHAHGPGLALWVHNLCGQSPLFGSMFLASSWNSETVHRKPLVFHFAAGPPNSGTSATQRTRLHHLESECLNTQPWSQSSIWILVSELSRLCSCCFLSLPTKGHKIQI